MNDEIKSLLDKAKDVAATAAETAGHAITAAGRKAGEMLDTARVSMQISDLKSDVGKRLRDIGLLVYRTHVKPETSADGLPEKLEEIDGLYARIAELEKSMEAVKARPNCPVCGSACDKSDGFCRACGHALGRVTGGEQA